VALLGVAVALLMGTLSVMVPVFVRRADKRDRTIERLEAANDTLRDANVDLKIQLSRLQSTAVIVDRTFTQLAPAEGTPS
jgi:cell division protein FtsB